MKDVFLTCNLLRFVFIKVTSFFFLTISFDSFYIYDFNKLIVLKQSNEFIPILYQNLQVGFYLPDNILRSQIMVYLMSIQEQVIRVILPVAVPQLRGGESRFRARRVHAGRARTRHSHLEVVQQNS